MFYKLIDFTIDFDFLDKSFRACYFKNQLLIFTKFYCYFGPITLQYLPSGAIQSLNNNELIIKVNNGFLAIKELMINNITISSKQFINEHKKELLNAILKGADYESC